MKGMMAVLLLLAAAASLAAQAPEDRSLKVEELRCEYLKDPLGIDVTTPRLSWKLSPGPRGREQTAYRVLVAGSLRDLSEKRADLWDSGKVRSDQSVFIPYSGRPLASGRRCYWKVRVWDNQGRDSGWSAPSVWSMGLLHDSDWTARFIGEERPAGLKQGTPLPFPWLRKTVTLRERPRRATAYVNSLGYHELYVNGRKVGEDVLSPAPSDFSRRNLYVTYDVTDYLRPGRNCLALWLGRGWYVRGHEGVVHDGPLVRAQVEAEMPDDRPVKIVTDGSWKLRESTLSPLGRGLAFGDYGGERCDARRELPGWNSVDLDDSKWKAAAVFDPPKVTTAAQMVEPNRVMAEIKAVKVEEFSPGAYLIDMGRNFTGWLQIRLPRLAPGTKVALEYADSPPSEGRFRSMNQHDEVIAAGQELIFRSCFNYHGFRYVRVTGLPSPPSAGDARGYLIHTSYEPAGEFTSSNDLLNRIYNMVTRTYRCLTLGGYVVDCPTRERLGYGGDAGTSIETGMFNFGSGGLYNRWSADWRAAQDPKTGDLPFTAPAYQDRGGGGPMWSGFVVTMPWHLYLQYGDRRALETNYPMVKKWLGYLESETVGHLLEGHKSYAMRLPQWTFLGDWVPPRQTGQFGAFGDPRSVKLINNCHYLYQLRLAAKMAAVLGKPDDAASYGAKAATLSRAIHERYFDPANHAYATGEQPFLAFPLLLDLPPADQRRAVERNLVQSIREKDKGHLNAGMHGTYFELKYLMEQGRNDLVYGMVNKTDFPSWGYMLGQGATTSWEDWSGRASHIHDTLISVGSWFIQGLGGIRIDERAPGFKHFLVRAAPVGDLKFANTSYRSPYGRIVSNWRVEGGVFHLDLTVPPNSTATVYFRTGDPRAVTESGRPAEKAEGVRRLSVDRGETAFLVRSGRYAFAVADLPR